MRKVAHDLALFSVVAFVGILGTACSNARDPNAGTVALALLSAPGVSITQVQWRIHNPALLSTELTGTVDTSRSGSLQFVVGGLPAGGGYSIQVTATTSTGVGCVGSAAFSVTARSTVNVSLDLVCTETSVDAGALGSVSINGQVSVVNPCAAVTALSASPSSVEVGGAINLSAQGINSAGTGTDVFLSWAITGGTAAASLANANSPSPTLTCTSAGTVTATVTASLADAGADCMNNTASIQLTCTPGGGVCVPETMQCDGLQPQTCDPSGTWRATGPVCRYVCSGGACSGTCQPGSTSCAGLQPERCDMTGTPQPQGSPCPAGCVNGACADCSPGQVRCSGMQPQVCDPSGAWQSSGSACSIVCINGGCGSCTPGAVMNCGDCGTQTCGANGSWGACVGNTNVTRSCNDCGTQSCGSTGVWNACSGNNGTAPPTCAALGSPSVCGNASCDATNGRWSLSACFSPNTCADYSSAGWVVIGSANGQCQYATTFFDQRSDSGSGVNFGSSDGPSLMAGGGPPNAQFDHAEISFHYVDGGCWCSNTTALQVECGGTATDYNVSETGAGCPSSHTGDAIILNDLECDIVQTEGWTPFAQGTCVRGWDLSDFWNVPFVCP